MDGVNSVLMARDYKYFEAARKAAGESDFKVHVGAIAVYQGRIIASASSLEKTHTMQKRNNKYRKFNQVGLCLPKLHAEIGLLAKIKKMNVQMNRVKIYIYRTCKNRAHGLARPCRACYLALVEVGIRSLYYTTDYGYAHEWIDYKEA